MEIRVYQVNEDRDYKEVAYEPYETVMQQGIDPYIYDHIFEGELHTESVENFLEHPNTELFRTSYHDRCLAVSDICELIREGQSEFYYCDSTGLIKIDFDASLTRKTKEKELTVVALYPHKTAEITKIPKRLEEYQSFVGGELIQAVYPFEERVCLVCNDDGKWLGMELNRALRTPDGEVYDIIAGNAFICDCSGEDFGSLNEDQQQRYLEMFKYPEAFLKIGDEIKAVKIKEEQPKVGHTQNHYRHR